MKTIFKGNPFSIVWNIIDRSTNHPFEFTGIKVEVGLYSDSFNFPLQSYNVNNGTITAEIEANTLPAGIFNIMCRYSTDHEQSYCTYRNAFQISSRPCHASEIVEIESYASHIDPSSEVPDAPDYCKCQLIAEELFGVKLHLPELTADRAIADEHGNRLPDTYVTRHGLTEHIKQTYNQQFLENPPLITEGYITPPMLSEETRQMLEATGQKITNLPDGEDLQAVHGVLKLANKEYNPNSYSGMGRQYLRKNIVAGVNILTQSMMQWPNTIYIIQYDYDLQGAEITIPEGCVLDFQGGSLSNGVIVGTNTKINYTSGRISVVLKGTYNNEQLSADWFGCVNSSDEKPVDNTNELTIAVTSSSHTGIPVLIPNITVYHTGIIMPENSALVGLNINSSILRLIDGVTSNNLTIIKNRCQVSNLTIYGNGRYLDFESKYENYQGNGICICDGSIFGENNEECVNTQLYNLKICYCGNNGLAIVSKLKWVYHFYNIIITRCANVGFLNYSTDNTFTGFNISHCNNLGIYEKGSRNRYSNMKIFICGYDYRNNDGTLNRPSGIYWQGLRIDGSFNIFSSIDIQECGGELLHISNTGVGNMIYATLDRPGYGKFVLGSFSAYNILGIRNFLNLSTFTRASYNEVESFADDSNYIIESVNKQDTGKGEIRGERKNYAILELPADLRISSDFITSDNVNSYLEFDGGKATTLGTINFAFSSHNKTKDNYFCFSFRLYLSAGTNKEVYLMHSNSNKYVVFSVSKNSSGYIQCGIQDGDLRNYSIYQGTSDSDYVNVYINQYGGTSEILVEDVNVVYSAKISNKERFITDSSLSSLRFFKGTTISDVHIAQGYLRPFNIGINQVYGTYYPLKTDYYAITINSNYGKIRTNVIGTVSYDKDRMKPIWWTGTKWVDATGTEV